MLQKGVMYAFLNKLDALEKKIFTATESLKCIGSFTDHKSCKSSQIKQGLWWCDVKAFFVPKWIDLFYLKLNTHTKKILDTQKKRKKNCTEVQSFNCIGKESLNYRRLTKYLKSMVEIRYFVSRVDLNTQLYCLLKFQSPKGLCSEWGINHCYSYTTFSSHFFDFHWSIFITTFNEFMAYASGLVEGVIKKLGKLVIFYSPP